MSNSIDSRSVPKFPRVLAKQPSTPSLLSPSRGLMSEQPVAPFPEPRIAGGTTRHSCSRYCRHGRCQKRCCSTKYDCIAIEFCIMHLNRSQITPHAVGKTNYEESSVMATTVPYQSQCRSQRGKSLYYHRGLVRLRNKDF